MKKRKKYRYENIITKENQKIIKKTLDYSFSHVIIIHMCINFIIPSKRQNMQWFHLTEDIAVMKDIGLILESILLECIHCLRGKVGKT